MMDDATHFFIQALMDDGEEDADEDLYETQLAAGVLVVGAEAGRLL